MFSALTVLRPLPEGEGPDRGVGGMRLKSLTFALSLRIPLIRSPRFFKMLWSTFSLGEKEVIL